MRFTVSLFEVGWRGLVRYDGMVSNPLNPDARFAAGFPVFSSGKRVTSEDVRALIDEDEPTDDEFKEDSVRVR